MRVQNIKSLTRIASLLIVLLTVAITSGTLTLPLTAENHSHSSVTGYFGLDDEGVPIVDRHGIMLVFDGAIAAETVSVATFDVFHDENSQAEVVDVLVDGAYVFLKLMEELASDATPILMIAEGEEVEDLAGNSTNRRKLGAIRIKDGIAPKLTVTLIGGSGTGTGAESPIRLTNKTIDIRITSDEPLQGAPWIVVACSELSWMEKSSDGEIKRDIDDFIANRNGPFPRKPSESADTVFTCGYDDDGDGEDDVFEPTELIAHSRPGDVWEYTWQNLSGVATRLQDGELAVVAFGRDRSRYERYGEAVSNWATAIGEFGLDTQFDGLGVPDGVKVFPEDGSKIDESRPFILIEFSETSAVSLNSVLLDGEEVADAFSESDPNHFVYWPSFCLDQGKHVVVVDASDAAGNSLKLDFEFETTLRCDDFILQLATGYNLISLPADPLDPSIDAVFTDPLIETIMTFDPSVTTAPWSMAVRIEGQWETLNPGRPLIKIRQNRGYWVESSGFVVQSVGLHKYGTRPAVEPSSVMSKGWHLVGVVDSAGNQTQNNFGEILKDQAGDAVSAGDYLGGYAQAYTWDTIFGRLDILQPNDTLTIGDGIWVHYGEGSDAGFPSFGGSTLDTVQGGDFELKLVQGWNVVSLPSEPLEPSIDAVFVEPSIQAVITWDPSATTAPWSVAVRRGDSGWETPKQFRSVPNIRQNRGYWVDSTEDVIQPIALHRYAALPDDERLLVLHNYGFPYDYDEQLPIATEGWYLVGVVDYAGNQTQDHYGEALKDQAGNPVSAGVYLSEYALAYTWEPITQSFEQLMPDDPILIGDGVWVYYEEDEGVAP